VLVELRQARLAVRSAKAARVAADEVATNAQKQLELAEGRYAEGVGNAIELGDAQVAMSSAAAQVVQADYRLSTARAQLLHALGR
jgi:outer membrane protein